MFEPMRYAALFGVLGVVLAGAAVQSAAGGAVGAAWVLVAAEGYVALCLFTMAAAYGLNHCGVAADWAFGPPGRVQAVTLLLLPYRVLARLTLEVLRRFDSMDLMHTVGTRIHVGRLPDRSEDRRLSEAGVTSILNLCAEFPTRPRRRGTPGMETAYLPLLDGAAPTERQFRAAVDWIAARHAEGHSVLVHCAQGRGRSVTVAAAALCRLGLATGPDDALAKIIAARPKAKPSRQQRVALSRFLGRDQGQTLASRPFVPTSATAS